jgi:ketosteroid isomerase-like protein
MSIPMISYKVAKEWLSAFNEHDLEKLLALYDEKAVHYSPKLKIRMPETKGIVWGKPAMRGWWRDAFDRLPGLVYREETITANEDRVFMEYVRIVPGEEDMKVAEVLEIRNGLVVASRVYHG